MTIDLDHFEFQQPSLQMTDVSLSVSGKRGEALLPFTVSENGKVVGRGEKRMVLSGLRAFDREVMDNVVQQYNQLKADYVRR